MSSTEQDTFLVHDSWKLLEKKFKTDYALCSLLQHVYVPSPRGGIQDMRPQQEIGFQRNVLAQTAIEHRKHFTNAMK